MTAQAWPMFAIAAALAWQSAGAAPQSERTAPPPATIAEDAAELARGWGYLSVGDTARAAAAAQTVLRMHPRSAAAFSLYLEAELRRGGPPAGLDAYEAWVGARTLEDGALLRRVARAQLWALASRASVGVEALQQLALDGDAEARAELARRMLDNSLAGTRALARLGDEAAVRRLIEQIEKGGPGSKVVQIQALVESGSPLAVPPLRRLLKDLNYQDHVAEAADGLGTLKAQGAVQEIHLIYANEKNPIQTRFRAAAGLFKLNDSRGLPLLQKSLASEFPGVALEAARAMAGRPDALWFSVVRGALTAEEPTARLRAAQLLAPYDREASRQVLERLLLETNEPVRQQAAQIVVRHLAGDFGSIRRFLRSADGMTQVSAAGRILELTR